MTTIINRFDGDPKITIDEDGDVMINDGSDWAVQYTALKSAFDMLKGDFNNLVTAYNAHVYTGVTAGPASSGPPAAPGVSSTADMTSSKIATIKVP